MSIATAITNLQGKIANAYLAIQEKGGTLPQVQNAENLSVTITDIPSGGGVPKWGMTLDEVCGVDNQGTFSPFNGVSGDVVFTGITDIRPNSIRGFSGSSVKSVSFPDLSAIPDMRSVFQNCSSLSSVSFQGLSSISQPFTTKCLDSTFSNCTALTSVSFPNLSAIDFSQIYISPTFGEYAFYNCYNLSSVTFPELELIAADLYQNGHLFNNMFVRGYGTWPTLTLSFPKLSAFKKVSKGAVNNNKAFFDNCTAITRIDLPKLTVITYDDTGNNGLRLFDRCTNLVEIHFGAENQAILEAADGYSSKWGAPNANCQIYFDL